MLYYLGKGTELKKEECKEYKKLDAALKAAETGHLVLSTLHTNDAVQTINRIINMFDETNRPIIRRQLADSLRATIAQKLVYSKQNDKRYPACEIMLVTPTIKDYILKEDIDEIYRLISNNASEGMTTLNQSLSMLVKNGLISEEEAISHSSELNELSKMLRGVYV